SLYHLGRYEEAEASLRSALAQCTGHESQANPAAAWEWIADTFQARDRHAEAEDSRRTAADMHKRLGRAADVLRNLQKAAASIRSQGRHGDAVAVYEEVLARGAEAEWGTVAEARFGMGVSLYRLGRYEEAETSFRSALAQYTEHESQRSAALALEWIADTFQARDRHAEAEDSRRTAADMYERLGRAADAVRILARAAASIRSQGRHGDAVAVYEEVLARGAEAEWGTVAGAHWGIGISLYRLGRYEEAEASFRSALAQYTGHESQADAALALEWIADTFQARDRHAEAEDSRRTAADMYERLGRAADAVRILARAADSIRSQGRHGDAVAVYEEVLARGAEAEWGTVAGAHWGIGISLQSLGRYRDSSSAYRLASRLYASNGDAQEAARSKLRLADNLDRENRAHEAVDVVRGALRQLRSLPEAGGTRGDAYDKIARILWGAGETTRSTEAFERAIFEYTRAGRLEDAVESQVLLARNLLHSHQNAAKARYFGAMAKAAAGSDRKSALKAAGTFAALLVQYGEIAAARDILDGVDSDPAASEEIPELRLARTTLGMMNDFSLDGSGRPRQRASRTGDTGASALILAMEALYRQDWEGLIEIHRNVMSDFVARNGLSNAALALLIRFAGTGYFARDRWREGEACAEEALRLAAGLPEGQTKWEVQSGAESLLGMVCLSTGREREAYDHFNAAAASAQKVSSPVQKISGLTLMAQGMISHPWVTEYGLRRAAQFLYDAAKQAMELDLSALAVEAETLRALAYLALDKSQSALEIVDFALGYAQRHDMPGCRPALLMMKAWCLKPLGDPEGYLAALREAAASAEAQGQFERLGDSLRELASETAEQPGASREALLIADSAERAYRRAGLPQEIALLKLDVVDELWKKEDEGDRREKGRGLLAAVLPALRFLDSVRFDFISAAQRVAWQRTYWWGRRLVFDVAAGTGDPQTVSDLIEVQINAAVFGVSGSDGALHRMASGPAVENGKGKVTARIGPIAEASLAATAGGVTAMPTNAPLPVSPPPNLLVPSALGARVALARFRSDGDLLLPAVASCIRTW
ncbi:tetratricopeptide repeat protein, partial [Sinomonas humi]